MTEAPDLGEIDGPLMVFGGPYSNLQATEALLAEARRRGIPPARMLCTGDVAAYCGDPQATVEAVRAAGIAVVMGNCEESLGSGGEDCGCGFEAGSSCDLLSAQWFGFARQALDAEAKAWMAGLPRRISLTLGGRRLSAIHGGIAEINRFVFPATPAADKAAELAESGAEGVIAGHSGLPFTEIVDGRLWHNAGVIGLPANDGTPRVWYALLSPAEGGLTIEHHPLDYDHAGAARAMRANGLPEPYAAALESGLWPADDIMPAADRERRGRPIAGSRVFWPRAEDYPHAASA